MIGRVPSPPQVVRRAWQLKVGPVEGGGVEPA